MGRRVMELRQKVHELQARVDCYGSYGDMELLRAAKDELAEAEREDGEGKVQPRHLSLVA